MKRLGIVAAGLALVALLAAGHYTARAQPVAEVALPAPGARQALYPGCNNISLTFPDGTASTTVAESVTPAEMLQSMWRHNASMNRFEGFSPAAPQASDLETVEFLDAVWLCIPIATPTAQATPATGPASASPATAAPTDALDAFAYVFEMSMYADSQFVMSYKTTGEFEAPDDVWCTIRFWLGGLGETMTQVVSTGEGAWMDEGDGFVAVSKSDSKLARRLSMCPGWPAFWKGFSLPAQLPSGTPETVNGVAAHRYSLAEALAETPASFGLAPSEMEGMTVNAFDAWLADEGGWLVRLVEDVSADLEEPEGEAEPRRVVIRVDITDANSPDIAVESRAP